MRWAGMLFRLLLLGGVVVLLSPRPAAAGGCVEELTDAAVCGTTVVEDAALCGVEVVTDAAECGTKKVADAAKCGTKKMTDGAECGWETFTSLARCGTQCVTAGNCSCKVAKSCRVAKKCNIAKTCEKPRSCAQPKTCTRTVAGCDPFPEVWKSMVVAEVNKNHKDHLDRLRKSLDKAPKPAELAKLVADDLADLPVTMGPYRGLVQAKAHKLTELLDAESSRELIKRIILKAAKREIDADVRKDVKALAAMLRVPQEDGKKVARPRPPKLLVKPTAVKAKARADDDADDDTPEEEGRIARKQQPAPPYPRVHAVMLNLGGGILANWAVAIGVVFDDEGNVKGLFSGGYGFGVQGRIGVDVTYTMIPSETLAGAGGVGIGVQGDAAYYGGIAVGVEWAVPAETAIPAWSVGGTVGIGGGVGYAYNTGYVF
jgi:hypothetical protein